MGASFAVVLGVFFLVTAWKGVVTVPQGMEYTIERFGKYRATFLPGFHWLVPYVDRIGRKLSMMEQVLDVPSQEVITKDNAMVGVDGVVFFQVLDAPKAAYEVHNLEYAIMQLAQTNLRTVMGSMDLDALLSNRDAINTKLLGVIDEATTPWGIKVTRMEVKDIRPPTDLVNAMARQMKAEREKRANILDAEGFRAAAILKAEGERQAQILAAEAQKEQQILEAEGRREAAFKDAEAREREAEAEAKATMMVSQAISKGDVQAINYFVATKYIDALGKIATSPNEKLVLMPLEAGNVIGALGGITELAKKAGVSAHAG
ncbi:SPFH domain-containing protein [Sinimarinibacterium sp. NLF-5-8]|uniref:SPFH domain-containing protein n=1 Tax=Sinimarinibacterium sp. NLF-5-8 TaxID=2698684 RepID=UPI00192E8714|nr:SPFH domain-containing protein [Sinimarinibacterium sp. NLF-5-8]